MDNRCKVVIGWANKNNINIEPLRMLAIPQQRLTETSYILPAPSTRVQEILGWDQSMTICQDGNVNSGDHEGHLFFAELWSILEYLMQKRLGFEAVKESLRVIKAQNYLSNRSKQQFVGFSKYVFLKMSQYSQENTC